LLRDKRDVKYSRFERDVKPIWAWQFFQGLLRRSQMGYGSLLITSASTLLSFLPPIYIRED
jgi:hypothetical protein